MFRPFSPRDLPCAIGGSPFRIKGTAYRHTWEACARSPGGTGAVLSRLPSDEARAFLSQTFLAGGWYDVLPMVWLDSARAELLGRPYEQSFAMDSVEHARASLGGIYRALLRLLSTGTVATVIPRLLHTYYDFGEVATAQPAPDEVSVAIRGVPALIATWYMRCSGAFAAEALALGGARGPQAAWVTPAPAGRRGDFALVDLTCHLRWKQPSSKRPGVRLSERPPGSAARP
jgi:hypothetical protein